jgi:hypothetical protein
MMGKAYGWGTFTFTKCKDGPNQIFGPIDESRLMVIVLGNWLKVTSYNRAISVVMCSHELNPQSLLCTINSVQYIQILNFDSDQSPRNI